MGVTPKALIPPYIINVYKPAQMSSQDIVRVFKRNLPLGFGKIGHFGTLDPFAEGVLMLGIAGAARLNDYIHSELPKTYVAHGVLGLHTETGDLTVAPSQVDDSDYLKTVIAEFSVDFIEEKLREHFLGEYLQAPHKYSAAKFQGKNLHEWARAGVEIKKEKKMRVIYDLKVIEYKFPNLVIEFQVSSGTYIRTLFSECAEFLGTLGTLSKLIRTKVGHINISESLMPESWPVDKVWDYSQSGVMKPWDVVKFPMINLDENNARIFKNGNSVSHAFVGERVWVFFKDQLLGLAEVKNEVYSPKIVWSL